MKAGGARPWLKWFPSDWRADPQLRMCSLAARGLWVELIGLMHEAVPYGHLLVNGKPPSVKQIAGLVGADAKEVHECLVELEGAGVFSRDESHVIFSRRMVRDFLKSKEGQEWANKLHHPHGPEGNPTGLPNGSPTGSPDGEGIGTPLTQRPEARGHSQKPEARRNGLDITKGESSSATSALGTRLPEDWKPPDDWIAWAMQERSWDRETSLRVADSFRDYWSGKPGADGRRSSWAGTWRNWVRKERLPPRSADGRLSEVGQRTASNIRRWIEKEEGGDAAQGP